MAINVTMKRNPEISSSMEEHNLPPVKYLYQKIKNPWI